MREIRKPVGIVITAVILILLIVRTQYLLRPNNTDQCLAAIKAFHNMPENSIDVILYGSSHGWRGVNPMEMYEKYGIAAYNYGGNWQCISTEALFFYDSLRTQSPKIAMIETYAIDYVLQDTDLNGEIYYTRQISDFPYKKRYLKQAFGNNIERYIAYYFPLSQFHSSWNEVKIDNFKEWYTVDEFENTMGYFSLVAGDTGDEVKEMEIDDPAEFEQYELCPEAVEILDGIVKTCEEKNIKLIFYTVPWKGHNNFSNALTRYADEHGCVYLDLFKLSEEVGLDTSTDFSDYGHLNRSGAIKTADFLGQYINETYDLEDMRKVDGNLWENKLNNITGKPLLDWKEKHPE